MLLVAASDIHGRADTYQWLVEVIRSVTPDLVVLAGDLLGAPESYETAETDQRHEAHEIANTLAPVECPVLYVMGNDDWIQFPPRSEWFLLHDQRLDFGQFNFVGYQNTPRFMGGPNERTEEEIQQELLLISRRLDSTSVLVTHGPARGILDAGHGSSSLRAFLDRNPFYTHIHGHSHSSFGRLENHFNVAAGNQKRAMAIELETLQHRVLTPETLHLGAVQ